MSESKQTTKRCPKCGNEKLLLIRTHNIKHCAVCNLDIPWFLEPKQKPLQ